MPYSPLPPALDCWYLTGPTASGKTRVGIELAERLGAEIIALDSMTVYRGMDIGTAKPSPEDRARVPHHLIDIVDPTEDFSLSQYLDAAHAKIAEIRARGREVLFVGGTPLYLKSLLRGVHQGPPADWDFRHQIDEELKSLPIEALHQRLQVIDPLLAAKLHPNDKRRIIRGLEVYRLTGQRLSHLQTQFDEARPQHQTKVFVLSWPRDELHARIDARVEQMFAAGLIEEVRGLVARYATLSRTAMQAVGYQEVLELIREQETANRTQDVGWDQPAAGAGSPAGDQEPKPINSVEAPELRTKYSAPSTQPVQGRPAPSPTPPYPLSPSSTAACIARVKHRTRQFARRQETWFRSLSECRTIPMSQSLPAGEIADKIAQTGDRPT